MILKPVNVSSTAVMIKDLMKSLNLQAGSVIPGVFNGKWGGNGKIIESVDPATNQVISKVQTGSIADLNETITQMKQAKLIWREVDDICIICLNSVSFFFYSSCRHRIVVKLLDKCVQL